MLLDFLYEVFCMMCCHADTQPTWSLRALLKLLFINFERYLPVKLVKLEAMYALEKCYCNFFIASL